MQRGCRHFVINCSLLGYTLSTTGSGVANSRGGGWVGGTKINLIRGGSAPRSDSLPFYIPFLAEKILLLYTFH